MLEIAKDIFGNVDGYGVDFVLIFWTVLIVFNLMALIVDVFLKGVGK